MANFLTLRTELGTFTRHVRLWADPEDRRGVRKARRGMTLPRLPRRRRRAGEVWGITMVKNEIDILPQVIAHLQRQGVDHLLISDNGSTDGTLEFLVDLAARGEIHLAVDDEVGYFQAQKMTRLARAAGRAGADWIVPFDADEFWFAHGALLGDHLRLTSDDVVWARMLNVFPTRTGWGLDPSPQLHGKVAFRSHRLARLTQGNHDVDRPGRRGDPDGSGLRIAHVPWRSFDQFVAKARQGERAYRQGPKDPALGNHWRRLAGQTDADLRGKWEAITAGSAVVDGVHWSPRGPLLEVAHWDWTTWDPEDRVESHLGPEARRAWE